MKTKIALALLAAVLVAIKSTNGQNLILPCPEGYVSNGITIHVDQFNFHKPHTGCQSRFGLCIQVHATPHCISILSGEPLPSFAEDSTEGKLTAYGFVGDSTLELHFPAAMANLNEFQNEDFSVFVVDDESIVIEDENVTPIKYVKEGEYTVKKVQNEFVIVLNLSNY